MLTKEQLAEIEQRAKKATPGPWEYDGMAYVWADGFYIFETRGFGYFTTHGMTKDEAEKQMDSNSIFCSHAREDIPALLEHIRELEAQLAKEKRRAERAVNVLERIKRDINEQDKIYIHIADFFGRGIYIDEDGDAE